MNMKSFVCTDYCTKVQSTNLAKSVGNLEELILKVNFNVYMVIRLVVIYNYLYKKIREHFPTTTQTQSHA